MVAVVVAELVGVVVVMEVVTVVVVEVVGSGNCFSSALSRSGGIWACG